MSQEWSLHKSIWLNSSQLCSRKNFVFLFRMLINLTIRVDAYFHLIRMTYPIQPGPFSRQHQIGESLPNSFSSSEAFELDRSLTVHSPFFSSSITTPWGKPSNLWTSWVYSFKPRVPSWIWIRWIQSATHRNNSKSLSTLAMSTAMQNSAQTPCHFIPGQHFLETFTLLSPNDQDHTFMDDSVPVLNQQTWLLLHLWQPYLTHTFNNALTVTLQLNNT